MNKDTLIVLLHGLGRTETIMAPMKNALTAAGFKTYSLTYPSKKYSIEVLAQHISKEIQQKFPNNTIFFITHSLGSLIFRYIDAHHLLDTIQGVVMLGPPNHGTAIIDLLMRFSWFRKLWGPAALELATNKQGIFHQLPEPITTVCAIIAGNRTWDPWFSWTILKGEDDGKVTVESTKLKGMIDHIVIPCTHTRLPKNKKVIAQTIYFLKENKFMHS